MKNFNVVIGADVRGYHQITIQAKSKKDAYAKALKELDESGHCFTWQTEDVQGKISIQVGDGEFKVFPNHVSTDYNTIEAQKNEAIKFASDLLTLNADLWDFIENVTDDDPERQDKFFALRERVRSASTVEGGAS